MRGLGRPTAGVYFPGIERHGGAEALSLQLADALVTLGYDTTVFTDGGTGEQPARDVAATNDMHRPTIHRLSGPGSVGHLPKELNRLRLLNAHARQLRAKRLDLFVNTKYRSQLPGCGQRNLYYCHFPHRLEVPAHGGLHAAYMTMFDVAERTVIDRSPRGFLGTYDRVWANSRFTARNVVERWGVPASVLYPTYVPVRPQKKEKIIISVGRFQPPAPGVPHKSQSFLLDAFLELSDLHSQGWRLVMVGGASEPEPELVSDLRRRASGAPVEVIVNATSARRDELLGRSSIYWHAQGVEGDATNRPETQEHFGISVVEAMSAGAIPLVFGHAGPAEIVGTIEGLNPWQSMTELLCQTRHWARVPDAVLAELSKACARRAGEFSRKNFVDCVQTLIADIPVETERDPAHDDRAVL